MGVENEKVARTAVPVVRPEVETILVNQRVQLPEFIKCHAAYIIVSISVCRYIYRRNTDC